MDTPFTLLSFRTQSTKKKANSVHALLRSVHTSTNLVVEYQFRVYKIRMIFA